MDEVLVEQKLIPLQKWAEDNDPSETNLFFKKGYLEQIMFVRDKLPRLLSKTWSGRMPESHVEVVPDYSISVIAEHVSKSVRLPVFRIETPSVVFVMRNNFHNWVVSVSSTRPVINYSKNLFDPSKRISHLNCEGFPEEWIFGSFNEDVHQQKFTLELNDNYDLFTFVHLHFSR